MCAGVSVVRAMREYGRPPWLTSTWLTPAWAQPRTSHMAEALLKSAVWRPGSSQPWAGFDSKQEARHQVALPCSLCGQRGKPLASGAI